MLSLSLSGSYWSRGYELQLGWTVTHSVLVLKTAEKGRERKRLSKILTEKGSNLLQVPLVKNWVLAEPR